MFLACNFKHRLQRRRTRRYLLNVQRGCLVGETLLMLRSLVFFRRRVKLVSSLLRTLATSWTWLLFWFDCELSLLLCRGGRTFPLRCQWCNCLLLCWCGWVVLRSCKVDIDAGIFIIIYSHLPVILVVVLVFEKCDPLSVGGKPTVEYDVLRDRYRADVCFVLTKTFGYNRNLVL